MRNFLASLVLLASLGACSVVSEDVTQVGALATASGDTELAACVKALGPLVQPKPAGAGVLYAGVAKYEASKLFRPGGACEGISAEIAAAAVQHFGL